MTREELIALAKEADCAIHEIAELERFAAIIEKRTIERCCVEEQALAKINDVLSF